MDIGTNCNHGIHSFIQICFSSLLAAVASNHPTIYKMFAGMEHNVEDVRRWGEITRCLS